MKEEKDYSLLNHNTFGIDVTAKRFVEYETGEELCAVLPNLVHPVLHIGGGSNLLFTGDYDGTVLHSAIRGITVTKEDADSVEVCVGAGEVWDDFVAWAVGHGYGGIENLSLIPGEVGASAVQNIGAYGVEAKDVISRVSTICLDTGKECRFTKEECRYSYRSSIFKCEEKGRHAITHVYFHLSKHPQLKLDYGNIRAVIGERANPTIADVRQAIIDIRNAKLPDPKKQGNAGSFFVNPMVSRDTFLRLQKDYPDIPHYEVDGGVKIPAGWMIERCGWKGKSLGKAGVYDKQALVLVNLGGATSQEILHLSEEICNDVHDRFGIDIHPEVNFI